MPPALRTLLQLIAARLGPVLTAAIARALVQAASGLRDRIADAADSTDDEAAVRAWVQHIDDLIEGGFLLEVTSDWLLWQVVYPTALRAWDELQDAAVRHQALEALGADTRELSPAAARVLLQMQAARSGRVRRRGPATSTTPLSPRPERVILGAGAGT